MNEIVKTTITINYFIKKIKIKYNLSNSDLSKILDVTPASITGYLADKSIPIEKAHKMNDWLKSKKEDLFTDYIFKYTKEEGFLFHGSRTRIESDINLNISQDEHDFGKGFYLGETFLQSSTWASFPDCKGYLYKIVFNKEKLKHDDLDGLDWFFFIAYNRGYIPNKKETRKLLSKITTLKTKENDYFFGKIADDRMNESMSLFFSDLMTDKQVEECLEQLKIGNQYCIKTNKAVKKLTIIEEYKIDDNLKELIAEYGAKARNEATKAAKNISMQKNYEGKKFSALLLEHGNK